MARRAPPFAPLHRVCSRIRADFHPPRGVYIPFISFISCFSLWNAWRKRVLGAFAWIWPFLAGQYFTQYWHPTTGEGGPCPRGELRDPPQRVKEREKTTINSLPRSSAPSCAVDRPLPPRRESKWAVTRTPGRRSARSCEKPRFVSPIGRARRNKVVGMFVSKSLTIGANRGGLK